MDYNHTVADPILHREEKHLVFTLVDVAHDRTRRFEEEPNKHKAPTCSSISFGLLF